MDRRFLLTPVLETVWTFGEWGVSRTCPVLHPYKHGEGNRYSPPDEQEDRFQTGCVRETLDLSNDETDCSTGRVRETLLPMNDKTDARTGRVRETPHPT